MANPSQVLVVVSDNENKIPTGEVALVNPDGSILDVSGSAAAAQNAAAQAQSSATNASNAAGIAQSSASQAVVSANNAETSAAAASDSASAANASYLEALSVKGTWVDTATGLANTQDGQVFGVPSDAEGNSIDLYVNSDGNAVATGKSIIDQTTITRNETDSLFEWKDNIGNIVARIELDGSLNIVGLQDSIQNLSPNSDSDNNIFKVFDQEGKIPLAVDGNGRIITNDILISGESYSVSETIDAIQFNGKKNQELINNLVYIDAAKSAAQVPQQIDTVIFDSSIDGYPVFRIPIFIRVSKNKWLAFCEGRASVSDFAKTDMTMKSIVRNEDNTLTVSDIVVLEEGQDDDGTGHTSEYINACACYLPSGRVLLFFTYRNSTATFHTPYLKYSDDQGETWSDKRDISGFFPMDDWNLLVFGPGVGRVLKRGDNKGRLVLPAWHADTGYPGSSKGYQSLIIYSDDNGESFVIGAGVTIPQSNESAIAESSVGDVLLFVRQENSGRNYIARSQDGGETFYSQEEVEIIDDNAICESGFIAADNDFDWTVPKILVSKPSDQSRIGLTLYCSYDDMRSATSSLEITSGASAYSSISMIDDTNVGVLYESSGAYQQVTLSQIPLRKLLG